MKNYMENKEKQNMGFSVISVIIAISFIGIMAMIVLYISMSNFYMKVTDLKAKDSFYTAERALDEIKVKLQEVVGEAMTDAYVEVLEKYRESDDESVEGLEQIRQDTFKRRYIEILGTKLKPEGLADSGLYDLGVIRSYVKLKNEIKPEETLKIVNTEGKLPILEQPNAATDTPEELDRGVRLRFLKIIYVDPKGHASIIETDIRLGMPQVKFPTAYTLPDLLNMMVVANKGIVMGKEGLENAAENTTPVTINGDVYAGQDFGENGAAPDAVSLDIQPNQKVYMNSGKHFVCLGEIHVADGAELHSAGSGDLWAQGLVVESGKVELTGKTYFADDLTLATTTNKSTGSSVSISGEYYGFGSPASAAGSYFSDNKYKSLTNTAKNSSIIVNGKGSTLDLSGVTKLMLAGNSYVGSSHVPAGEEMDGHSNSADILMGESITVKGNQLAYLMPSECFRDSRELLIEGNKTMTNPMSYDDYVLLMDGNGLFDMDKPVDAWGGKSMNQLGLDEGTPVQKVFYSTVGGGFVYFYLNFANGARASEYFEQYYNNPAIKSKMDKYLDFYLGGEGKGIYMQNPALFLRFVTNGNILNYENGSGNLMKKTAENTEQEQITLQNMWFSLTRKMITSYDLLKDNVKRDAADPGHSEKDKGRFVFDNLVDETTLDEFLASQGSNYEYTSPENSQKAYVIEGNFDITEENASAARLVVATGDVTIKKNVSFEGIIMTKGKLYMEPGSSLTSNPSDAAKIFYNQCKEEPMPMDFFWDGDKYMLGSSIITDDTEEEEETEEDSIYDISECITFEHWVKK